MVADSATNVAVAVEESFDAWLVRLLRRRRRSASQTLVVGIAVAALLPDTFAEVDHVEAPDSSNVRDVVAAVAVFVPDVVVAAAGTSGSVHSLGAFADMPSTGECIHIASAEVAVLADEDDLEAPDWSLCDGRACRLLK